MKNQPKSALELYKESQSKGHEFSKHLLQIRYATLRETTNDLSITVNEDEVAEDRSKCDTCLQVFYQTENSLVFCELCNVAVHQ